MCAPSRRGGGGPGAPRTRRPPLGSWPGGLRPSRWRPVSTPGQAEARRGRGLHRQGAGRGVSGAARTAPRRPAHSSSDPDGVSGRHGRGVDGAQAGKERVRTIAAARQASAVGLMPVVAAGVGAPGRPDVPCRRLYSCWTALRGYGYPNIMRPALKRRVLAVQTSTVVYDMLWILRYFLTWYRLVTILGVTTWRRTSFHPLGLAASGAGSR